MKDQAPTHIVHVTECLASGTMHFLVQATRELAAAGVSQTLVYSRRPDTPADVRSLFDARVELIELPPLGRAYRAYMLQLRQVLQGLLAEQPQAVVHLHSSKAGFLGRLALRRLRPQPRVFYSPHGLAFLNRRYVLPGVVFRSLEWLAARALPCTPVGCSDSEAELLTALGPRAARVLENPVDDSFFEVRRTPTDVPLIVTMGRICYQKAPERFAKMAVRFRIADVPARFVWIGEGDAADTARLRAAGVEVTGWVDQAEIKRVLGQASLYVQTSRWEGMPLSVLQALAAGVPCVVTDVVGNRDAVRQGFTGFVVDDDDAMLVSARRLLRDESLRQRMAAAARQDARERFSGASFRHRLYAFYGLKDAPLHLHAAPRLHLLDKTAPTSPRPKRQPAWRQQVNG